jgi:hypothetical protein
MFDLALGRLVFASVLDLVLPELIVFGYNTPVYIFILFRCFRTFCYRFDPLLIPEKEERKNPDLIKGDMASYFLQENIYYVEQCNLSFHCVFRSSYLKRNSRLAPIGIKSF